MTIENIRLNQIILIKAIKVMTKKIKDKSN